MIVEYVRTYLEMTDPANLCQPPTRLVRAHNDIVLVAELAGHARLDSRPPAATASPATPTGRPP